MATASAANSHGPSAADPGQRVVEADDRAQSRRRAQAGEVAYEDLVQSPRAWEPEARTLAISDVRVVGGHPTMRVVGVGVLAVSVVLHFVLGGGQIRAPLELLSAAVVVLAGVALIAQSYRGRVRRVVPLFWLSQSEGWMRFREHAGQLSLSESREVPVEAATQVIFARRMLPADGRRGAPRVELAGVFVRLDDGAVWPVVPATSEADTAYRVAQGIALRLGVHVKQVGHGWTEDAPQARVLH